MLLRVRPAVGVALAALALSLLLPVTSAASIITYTGSSGPALGTVTVTVSTPSPGNADVAGASPNVINVTTKQFDNIDAIWMTFDVADDGIGTTEYLVTETVTNNSGVDWIGYQLMLGTGTDGGWVQSPLGTQLDFDIPDDDSPRDFTPFTTLVYDDATIDAVSGLLTAGSTATFTYVIDVPNSYTDFSIRSSPRVLPVPVKQGTWGSIKALYQ